MKKHVLLLFVTYALLAVTACDDDSKDVTPDTDFGQNENNKQLSEKEITKGLKEALKTGTKRAVDTLNRDNGYFKDQAVKILFPPEANKVKNKLRDIGAGDLVDKFVKKLNRAAEDAAGKASPIFVDAVTDISFQDARNILEGSDSAATHYFRENTADELFNTFKPDIENSLDEVEAQDAWESVTNKYNSIPTTDPVETDLAKYTTDEALEGLFLKLKKEEKQIRLDPVARTKDILEKVFSTLDDD